MKNRLPSAVTDDRSIDRFYAHLDRRSLGDVARLFAGLARHCKVRAADWDHRDWLLKRAAKERRSLDTIGDVIAGLMAGGAGFDQAARQIEAMGYPYETIIAHWRAWQRRETRTERARRDHLIMRLYRAGWRDREIAERVELHAKTVNKIIRRELRAAA